MTNPTDSKASLATLIEDVKSDDFDRMIRAIQALGELGDPEAIEVLTWVGCNYDDEDLWYDAWWAIKDILEIDGFVAYVSTLYRNTERDDERSNYIVALGNFGGQAAVPFYKELVENGASEDVLHSALWGIGRAGGEENIAFLKAYSTHCPEELKDTLESALAQADPTYFNALKHLASDDAEERRDACMFLENHPRPEANARLMELLDDRTQPDFVRFKAAEALGAAMEVRALDSMVRILRDRDEMEWVRATCARQLGHLGDCRAVAPMTDYLLAEYDGSNHSEAAIGLGRLGCPEAVPALIQGLAHPQRSVRQWCCEALGDFNVNDGNAELINCLADEDHTVREYAAGALGARRCRAARAPLLAIVRNADTEHNDLLWRTSFALGRIADPGDTEIVDALIPLLSHTNGLVRSEAVETLVKLNARDRIDDIVPLLADDALDVRTAAIEAVGLFGDASHLPALRVAGGRKTSIEALVALLRLGDEPSRDVLVERLCDEDERPYAACALLTDGDERGFEGVIEGLTSRYWNIRLRAIEALGYYPGQATIDALTPLLRDSDTFIREAAQTALKKLDPN